MRNVRDGHLIAAALAIVDVGPEADRGDAALVAHHGFY